MFPALVDCPRLLDHADPAIGVHDQNKVRFRQYRDVRIVSDEDHLPALLEPLHRVHHGLKNKVVVQVVLGLINEQRAISSCQENWQQRGALLAAGKIGRVFEIRLS